MKRSDSKTELNTWHKRKGTSEKTTSLYATVKLLPRSSGYVVSRRMSATRYVVIRITTSFLIPISSEYAKESSVLININDPAIAATDTSRVSGSRRLFLIIYMGLFSESIVNQYLEGLKRIFFIPVRRNR
jgi:hypothetical protein